MREVLGVLVFAAAVVALWARGRRRRVSDPVYNLWDPPKRPKRVRMKHRRWSADDLLREMAAAPWPEEEKK